MGNAQTRTVAIPAAKSGEPPIVAKYAAVLEPSRFGLQRHVDERAPLIPLADLPPLIGALEARVHPASAREVGAALALIAAAWPHAHQRADQTTLELFGQQMAEDLAEFPADVLTAAIRQVRRELKFAPSIAELYQAATELVWPRHAALRMVRDHMREHERRAEATRQAHAKAAADREEAERHAKARLDKLRAVHGSAAAQLTVADVLAAQTAVLAAGFQICGEWWDAIDTGEAWAIDTLPLAAVFGEAWPEVRAGRMARGWLSRAISGANGDAATARRLLAEPNDGDDRGEYAEPSRVMAEIVRDARRRDARALAGAA